MTKLERHLHAARCPREKLGQPRHVFAEEGWQLEEKGPEARSHGLDCFDESRDGVLRVFQLRRVRDALRSFHREGEIFRDLFAPAERELGGRHAIERIVDLDRRKTRRVKAEKVFGGEVSRIKGPLPFFIGVAARSDLYAHGSLSLLPQYAVACAPLRRYKLSVRG